jgi:hypothetical protein
LTSAINLIGPDAASGVKKLRTAGADANLSRNADSGIAALRRATSARLVATILSRIVGIRAIRWALGWFRTRLQTAFRGYDHLNDAAEKRYRWQREPPTAYGCLTPISLLACCHYYPAAMFYS